MRRQGYESKEREEQKFYIDEGYATPGSGTLQPLCVIPRWWHLLHTQPSTDRQGHLQGRPITLSP